MTTAVSQTGPSRSAARPGRPRLALAVHGGLIALTLLVCLGLPRSGHGILLVPLATDGAGISLRRADLAGMTLLGRGLVPGSIVVRATGPVPLGALLRDGIVPLGVPLSLCGDKPAADPVPPANPFASRGFHG